MKATTVKIDGKILDEIKPYLEESQTITAFIRESVQHEIKRKKMKNAASLYMENLEKQKREEQELNEWESADLSSEIDK